MKLSKYELKKVQLFINSKSKNAGFCPICGKDTVSIEPTIYQLREFNSEGNIVLGKDQLVEPLIPIVYTNCGYTTFINAIKAGIIKGDDL